MIAFQVGQPLIAFDHAVVGAKAASLQTAVMVTTGETGAVVNARTEVKAGQDPVFMLGTAEVPESDKTARVQECITITESFVLKNPQGLHARPAASLVQIIKHFNSQVEHSQQRQ